MIQRFETQPSSARSMERLAPRDPARGAHGQRHGNERAFGVGKTKDLDVGREEAGQAHPHRLEAERVQQALAPLELLGRAPKEPQRQLGAAQADRPHALGRDL
jgi:hypothetical protein